jgi:hypothetical protein
MAVVDIPIEQRIAFAIPGRAAIAHSVETPVTIGDLIDRITILEIKAVRFTDRAKQNQGRRSFVGSAHGVIRRSRRRRGLTP